MSRSDATGRKDLVMRLLWLLPALLLPLAACGSDASDAGPIEVTGNLTYVQRIALTPGGTATITLEDVSVADAAAPVIAEQTIELEDQQVPIAFELSVDTADLDSSRQYSVRAEIVGADGSLAWTTDTVNPLDIGPDGEDVDMGDLVLVQVESSGAAGASPLTGTWNVTDVDGSPVVEGSAATLVFGDDGTLSGTTGCNSYTTDVTVEGDQLILGEIAVTLMACLGDVAAQEEAFLAVLNDSPTYELVDAEQLLTLESASGSTLSARR